MKFYAIINVCLTAEIDINDAPRVWSSFTVSLANFSGSAAALSGKTLQKKNKKEEISRSNYRIARRFPDITTMIFTLWFFES